MRHSNAREVETELDTKVLKLVEIFLRMIKVKFLILTFLSREQKLAAHNHPALVYRVLGLYRPQAA